jgi:uncharacterized membrane protein YozB (DUF420 family)
MEGFLGTEASLWSDLSLILVWGLGIAAILGAIQARRERFARHCPIMAAAALSNWAPVLLVMIPTAFEIASGEVALQPGLTSLAPIGHGVLGTVTQLLMTYTVTRMYWAEQLPPEKPIWLMRTTLTLWILTAIGGTSVYMLLYLR